MSLSFEESLKNNNEEYPIADEDIILENENIEPTSIMAYSMRSMPMLLMDNDGWEKPDNYANYDYLNGQYEDEDFSTVDNNKNIQLSANQVNITQEKNSQYIPFKIPRRYDGFDLADTTLSIYYVNKNKQWGKDTPVDVYCNEDSIKFAWLVGERATSVSGILQFEIHAVGKNRLGNDYVWKTKSIATLNIIQSLEEIADGQIGLTEADAQDLFNQISRIESNVFSYLNQTKDALNQAQSLVDKLNNGIRDTVEEVLDEKTKDVVNESIANELDNYYTKLETYTKDEIEDAIENAVSAVDDRFGALVDDQNKPLTVQEYVKQEVDNVDVSEQLGAFGKDGNGNDITNVVDYVDYKVSIVDISGQLGDLGEHETVTDYVDNKISEADISSKLGDYYKKTETYSKEEIDDALDNVSVDLSDYYKKGEVDNKVDPLSSSISILGQTVASLQGEVASIDKSPRKTYEATYENIEMEDGTVQENMFTLWETEGDGQPSIKSRFKIVGGGGGAVAGNNLVISYRKDENGNNISQYVFTAKNKEQDEVVVYYDFSGTDSAGDIVPYANATWKTRKGTSGTWTTVSNTTIYPGENLDFNVSKYIATGTYQVQLVATDESGGYASKTWTIQIVDIRLESGFNDTFTHPAGQQITFDYTPHGAISKTVHFKLYDEESKDIIYSKDIDTSASGTPNPVPFIIPAQEHGSYLLEAYITAKVNGQDIETDHIYKDIIFYDSAADTPVIGCSQQTITMRQYDTVEIVYSVYDPKTETPSVEIWDGASRLASKKLTEGNIDIYPYKATDVFEEGEASHIHTVTIKCKDVTKTLIITVEKINIDVQPVTANLAFDFNPVGYSNNDTSHRLWSDGDVKMTVSDNFDWINGGYKQDGNGDSYFLIKAGTRASINYLMFDGGLTANPSVVGAEMKLIFMTENVQDKDGVWFSNVETTTTEVDGATQTTNVGIQLGVHEGWLKTNNASDTDIKSDDGADAIAATNTYLYMPYSEEDIIELDINIDTLEKGNPEAKAFAMAYEDGVPSKAYVYDSSDRFYQYTPQPITIGCDYCDVRIYRMKVYSASLTTENIMKNFIADARNSTTMLDRYDRNSIYYNRETNTYTPYSGEGVIDPEKLAPIVPNVKILMLETDHFTTSKKTFVKSNFRCIHAPGGDMFKGDAYYDNWLFENGYHSGQGTTSDNYGNSSRNVDFLFNCDGIHKPSDKVDAEADYISQVTLGYGSENETTEVVTDWKGDSGKVTLTRTSVPNNFFNLKVNVASSENVNNMLLQKRYNDFLPYISPAKQRNPNVKCTMEFVPAILFIRETNPDISTHTEFLDTEWHFYSLGNIGDSKKSDYTRAYDPEDMNEFTIEISDNTKNNATFQSGVYLDGDGNRQIEKFTITETEEDGEVILTPVSTDKPQSFVYPITIEEWENEDNMRHWCIYNEGFDGDHSFEARYACCGDYRDGKLVNDTSGRGKAQMKLNEGVWRAFYRWVVTSTNEEFVNELDEWCVRSAVEFFYAFTHYYTMMDNRAKNTFWHFAKTGVYRKVSKPVPELLHIYCELIDSEYITTSDTVINSGKTYYTQYAFDIHDYDNDTALGINNNGELVFPYGKEDTDYNIEGNPLSGYVFNGATSVFWCRLRDLLPQEIKTTFQTVASECFSATNLINQFDAYQECYPEEIWRLDIYRKYIRTFTGKSVDNSKPKHDVQYLRDMMQGRKKYQRRQWTRDQELYFGTMNLMNTVVGDDNRITFRCFTPTGKDVVVKPDYTLKITPYSDMYISVAFGNSNPRQLRAKAGIEYEIECPLATMDDTQVTIYGANRIQALSDLSACYIAANNFSMATKLRKLVLGSTVEGYNNSKLVSLTLGNNKLLEELDIRNCNNLTGSLNLVPCNNLLKLYAEGTKITGVTFATNGKIQVAHLPSTINTLIMRNLNNLVDFQATLSQLETLTLQGGTLDSLDIVTRCIKTLQVLYLYDIDWVMSDVELLNDISLLFYSLLTGKVWVPQIGTYDLLKYQEKWSDLTIDVPEGGTIPQYQVIFRNDDGFVNPDGSIGTILDIQYIDQYGNAIDIADPANATYENYIGEPTKASDIQYDYQFVGWDKSFTNIQANMVVTAVYTPKIRKYKVQYRMGSAAPGSLIVTYEDIPYGSNAMYDGETPKFTGAEPTMYYLFKGWDKSGIADGDFDENGVKVVNALWDTFTSAKGFNNPDGTRKKLQDLSPVEIYALIDLSKRGNINIGSNEGQSSDDYVGFIADGNILSFTLGHDFNYDDVPSIEIIGNNSNFGEQYRNPVDFTRNYLDTGIQLFGQDTDKDFVLAIDYEFTGDTENSVLAQCYRVRSNSGFQLLYNDGARLKWNSDMTSSSLASKNQRETLVIQHKKGESNIRIYSSNLNGKEIYSNVLVGNGEESQAAKTDTLIFGCEKQSSTSFGNYASGKIYWAKLWEKDIGEEACRELAAWTHEDIELQACGFGRYYVANTTDDEKSSFSLLATHLLDRPKRWNPAPTKENGVVKQGTGNAGGWAASELNEFLNTRLYNAMPSQIKSLIKRVEVKSSVGNSSKDVGSSNCYIMIPSVFELDSNNYNSSPYNAEGSAISYMINPSVRQRAYNDEMQSVEYWTRSPYLYPSITHSSAGSYVNYVSNTGAITQIGSTNTERGVLIMMSF